VTFRHTSSNYPGDHNSSVTCRDCHGGNTEAATWTSATYRPDCAGCHANDYDAGEHRKTQSPSTNYTVSELRDCSGPCHTYTDSSLTTIANRRDSEHRARDGDF